MIDVGREVYEKIWSGNIDRIMWYDEKTGTFTVDRNGKVVTHMTSLDANNLSFTKDDFKCNNDVIRYLINKGVTKISNIPLTLQHEFNNSNNNMTELIDLLKKINSEEINAILTDEKFRGIPFLCFDTEIDIKIQSLACKCLIDNDGKCDWVNINELKSNKFDVFPLEKDSFGWLIGGIKTNKGIISYG